MIFKNQKTAIILSVIILFLVGIKSFGILDFFRMSSSTMEPAIHKDHIVLATNLLKIYVNDLIIFKIEDFSEPVSFRVVGNQGDTIEIIEGVLYINGQKESEINKTLRQYKVSRNKFMQIKDSKEIMHTYESYDLTFIDTFLVVTNKEFANSMNLQKNVYDNMYEDKEIEKVYGKKWNRDNLGPLHIPENKFFVLGDHGGDSFDSRYFGLLDKKDIIGKILISL